MVAIFSMLLILMWLWFLKIFVTITSLFSYIVEARLSLWIVGGNYFFNYQIVRANKRIFVDEISGDELLSDSFPYKEIENGMLWEVDGKVRNFLFVAYVIVGNLVSY